MKPSPHHQRHNADQEFQQSLAQLEDILQENSPESQVPAAENPSPAVDHSADETELSNLAALEDAVADIEQYLEHKNHQS
jgi:hypothetical protein